MPTESNNNFLYLKLAFFWDLTKIADFFGQNGQFSKLDGLDEIGSFVKNLNSWMFGMV